jgi:hypothetical protein
MNPATQIGIVGFLAVLSARTVYELVLLIRRQSNGKSNPLCNYPLLGTRCAWESDSGKVRTYELTDALADALRPEMAQQNTILKEIRDAIERQHRT